MDAMPVPMNRDATQEGGAPTIELRRGGAADAAQLCVLATHVFVDTYCQGGLRPDQAREALSQYAVAEFERRVAQGHEFTLACRGEHLLGFAETACVDEVPLPEVAGALELMRLYIGPGAQRQGLGRTLLAHAEERAMALGCDGVWLGAWVHNVRALAFYAAMGCVDVGRMDYVFEGRVYENRVLFKRAHSRALEGHFR